MTITSNEYLNGPMEFEKPKPLGERMAFPLGATIPPAEAFFHVQAVGLTIRQYTAIHALAGLMAKTPMMVDDSAVYQAVSIADALLAELEKRQ